MSRLQAIDPETATGPAKAMLDGVKAKLGLVPNMMRTMANSPTLLAAYLGFSDAMSKGSLDLKTREMLSLAISQANGCQYCVSAHHILGKKAGLSAAEVQAARTGHSADPKQAAVLQLALAITLKRSKISDADLAAARQAGVTDAEVADIVGLVACNVLTNYFNNVAEPEIDFPVVQL